MSDSIRTFIAAKIPLPTALRPVLRSLATMNWPVSAVSPDNLHVTLKFLGETSTAERDAIQQLVSQTIVSQLAFGLHVVGLSAFPNVDRPSVVWAGLQSAEPLATIAERLETSLAALGFARETRQFHAHLTLARVKGRPPRDLFELLRKHAKTEFGTVKIAAIEFIRSDRERDGAHYTTLSNFPLA